MMYVPHTAYSENSYMGEMRNNEMKMVLKYMSSLQRQNEYIIYQSG